MTRLYWAFLERKGKRLAGNRRMALPLKGIERRSAAEKARDRRVFDAVRRRLAEGTEVSPGDLS